MKLRQVAEMRVLYFDLECKPGHWIGGDYVSKIITAGAYAFGEDDPTVLTHYEVLPGDIAREIANAVRSADLVVGHYIRGFDLPLLNGELLRAEEPPLGPVLSHDTKEDLYPAHGRSKSQKNLGADLKLDNPKIEVTLAEWEGFNGRYPGFEEKIIERVVGDVVQNRELRLALIDIGWIGPPTIWQPDGREAVYVP